MAIYVMLRSCDGLGVVSRPVHAHGNLGCAVIVRTRTDNIKFLAVDYRARARRITLCFVHVRMGYRRFAQSIIRARLHDDSCRMIRAITGMIRTLMALIRTSKLLWCLIYKLRLNYLVYLFFKSHAKVCGLFNSEVFQLLCYVKSMWQMSLNTAISSWLSF